MINEIYIIEYTKTIFDENEIRQIISFTSDVAFLDISLAYKKSCEYIISQGWSEIFLRDEEIKFWDKFFMYYEKEKNYRKAYEMIFQNFSDNDDFPKVTTLPIFRIDKQQGI